MYCITQEKAIRKQFMPPIWPGNSSNLKEFSDVEKVFKGITIFDT